MNASAHTLEWYTTNYCANCYWDCCRPTTIVQPLSPFRTLNENIAIVYINRVRNTSIDPARTRPTLNCRLVRTICLGMDGRPWVGRVEVAPLEQIVGKHFFGKVRNYLIKLYMLMCVCVRQSRARTSRRARACMWINILYDIYRVFVYVVYWSRQPSCAASSSGFDSLQFKGGDDLRSANPAQGTTTIHIPT